jgi:putative transposase
MGKNSTASGTAPPAIVADAWQQVGASFDRFCLTSGVAALHAMMEQDATQLCGPRYGHKDGCDGHRWGRAKGRLGFHGGKVLVERPRVRVRDGQEMALPSWETAQAEDWLGRWAEAAKVPSALSMESCRRG